MSQNIPEVFKLININVASQQTQRWQTNKPGLKAFLFHRAEIEEVQAEPLSVNIRFYMGLLDISEIPPGDSPYKMVVVGVDHDKQDIIVESETNSKIFDFALPCPRVCDDGESPLMNSAIRTNEDSTPEVGNIQTDISKKVVDPLFEIPFSEATGWTFAWQEVNPLKSVLFSNDDLLWLFEFLSVATVRVYFAERVNGAYNFILIGVDIDGNDIVPSSNTVFTCNVPPCSIDSISSCDVSSPLNHIINVR